MGHRLLVNILIQDADPSLARLWNFRTPLTSVKLSTCCKIIYNDPLVPHCKAGSWLLDGVINLNKTCMA